jgi:GNAT superfamily N-acetyltransferase
MPHSSKQDLVLRPAKPEDAEICGRIAYDAFVAISGKHGFPCDFPGPEVAIGLYTMLFAHPHFYCVVAELGGRLVGSNCLDERSSIAGVGPITVDCSVQNGGVGRALMHAVLDRVALQGRPGVRLVQAGFHCRSLTLYANLGFAIREPLACLQGRTTQREIPGCEVRAAHPGDVDACNALARSVHGFDRDRELQEAIGQGTAVVVERGGQITGYASALAFFSHATALSNPDLQAMIAAADGFAGPGILVPSRNTQLLHWCLANGLRMVQPMTLMSFGLYSEPAGAWLPSVTF